MAGCSIGERHVPPTFRLQGHDLRIFVRYSQPKRGTPIMITFIIFSYPFGDRDTMPLSSAYSIPHKVLASSFFFCPSILPTCALAIVRSKKRSLFRSFLNTCFAGLALDTPSTEECTSKKTTPLIIAHVSCVSAVSH